MEFLFQLVPRENQISSLQLLFSTAEHGYSLTTLYNSAGKCTTRKGMIFCIKTSIGDVFGGYCGELFKITQIYYIGSEESFVFSLLPKREVFKSAGVNTYYLRCDTNSFSFGGSSEGEGKGEAIRIEQDFATGTTYSSETFNNKPLTGEAKENMFKCAEFEVYALK